LRPSEEKSDESYIAVKARVREEIRIKEIRKLFVMVIALLAIEIKFLGVGP
jgi:hypothetical protein